MKTFKEDLANRKNLHRQDDPLLALTDMLATLPAEKQENGKFKIKKDAATYVLKQCHPAHGNLASHLLTLLAMRRDHTLADASSDPYQNFLYTVWRAYQVEMPGQLLLAPNVYLDLNDILALAYPFRQKIMKAVYGVSPTLNDDAWEREEVDEYTEETRTRNTSATIPAKLNDLAKKRADVQRQAQERIHRIDDRMAKLRKKQSENRIKNALKIGAGIPVNPLRVK